MRINTSFYLYVSLCVYREKDSKRDNSCIYFLCVYEREWEILNKKCRGIKRSITHYLYFYSKLGNLVMESQYNVCEIYHLWGPAEGQTLYLQILSLNRVSLKHKCQSALTTVQTGAWNCRSWIQSASRGLGELFFSSEGKKAERWRKATWLSGRAPRVSGCCTLQSWSGQNSMEYVPFDFHQAFHAMHLHKPDCV